MIQERSIQIRVGIFVTAGLLLIIMIVFLIGSERSWFEDRYTLYCSFDNVSGLGPGASVSLAGMRVGAVKDVRFPEQIASREVVVELDISQRFMDRIRGDSYASIATQGLLGDKQIVLSVGTPDAAPLQDGARIRTQLAEDLFSIGSNANQLISKAFTVMEGLEKIMEAAQSEGLLHALIFDPQNAALLNNATVAVQSLRTLLSRVEDGAEEANLGQIVQDMQQVSNDLQIITGQVRRGEGTIGGLLTDASIYEDLRAIFGKAQRSRVLKSTIRSMLKEQDKKTRVERSR